MRHHAPEGATAGLGGTPIRSGVSFLVQGHFEFFQPPLATLKGQPLCSSEAHPVGLLTFPPVLAFISASGAEVGNRTFLRGFGLCWICLILLKADSKDYL